MSKRYTEPQPQSEPKPEPEPEPEPEPQPDPEPESESEFGSESESESESVSASEKVSTRKEYTSSETSSTSVSDDSDSVRGVEQQQSIPNSEKNVSLMAKQQGCSQLQSSSTSKIEKGSTPAEVTEISKVQYLEGRVQQAKEKANNKFMKIFNFQDEEIILEALLKSGHKDGTSDFWTAVGQSLQLSIPATQTQVYGKIRRLKENYVKRLSAENSNQVMSQDEEKLHKLCTDIWGTILKPKEGGGCEKKPQAVLVEKPAVSDNFQKLARAIRMDDLKIRVEEAINFLPPSKRPKIEQKWNDVCVSMLQLYTRGIELMQEIIREAASGE